MYNPSLREEPRNQPAEVIPLKQEFSLLDWLENTGRLIAREAHDPDGFLDDEEEIDALIVDESPYDLEDDGDDDDLIVDDE
ncbi:MAG: DUF3134 domain-containing protein [Oscillatoria princeps RMCB-10]|jgi:hypothetical protein|nr:DUF3134 domain-containing protein [Oscillatoria princeps RMCB-10]